MKQPEPSSVVVAMSGGVDSSLAAALLKEQGWEVFGVHFLLPAPPPERGNKRRAAEQTAGHLGIPLHVVDLTDRFEQTVIGPFVSDYLAGRTPNPCVVCNPDVKFAALREWADEHEAAFAATGHYANVFPGGGGWALFRGRDPRKEQSYFLHRLDQRVLRTILFPLGAVTKPETRTMAAARGLPCASAPESQEVCFLSGEDYRRFLLQRQGEALSRRGHIVDREGRKLGEHQGTFRYTVGQRRGLNIASDRPYHVLALRPDQREVVVGRREDLLQRVVEAEAFAWPSGPPPERELRAEAQVRYRHRASSGRLERLAEGRVRFVFDEPQFAVAPGQALVCYDGERVLGGGWIVSGS